MSLTIQVNDKCPRCGFAAMPPDAEPEDALLCPTCGEKLNVCGTFMDDRTAFRAWLESESAIRTRLRAKEDL